MKTIKIIQTIVITLMLLSLGTTCILLGFGNRSDLMYGFFFTAVGFTIVNEILIYIKELKIKKEKQKG